MRRRQKAHGVAQTVHAKAIEISSVVPLAHGLWSSEELQGYIFLSSWFFPCASFSRASVLLTTSTAM